MVLQKLLFRVCQTTGGSQKQDWGDILTETHYAGCREVDATLEDLQEGLTAAKEAVEARPFSCAIARSQGSITIKTLGAGSLSLSLSLPPSLFILLYMHIHAYIQLKSPMLAGLTLGRYRRKTPETCAILGSLSVEPA